VRFIPTITWSGGEAIHAILSDSARRKAHVQAIASEVYAQRLDGIDIDYEGKLAETNPYFSAFLRELAEAIGFNKWIMCTIEARTPLDSRFASPADVPSDIAYANDYVAINKYCDRVRIMAYDQGRYDLKLNKEKPHPYVPVADTDWVRKTIELAAQEIDRNKLMIGVPTYGYEYDMYTDVFGATQYSRLWSFNQGHALEVAGKLSKIPERNSAGELFLIYPAKDAPDAIIPLPDATRVMSWSDAEAIRQKFELARELGIAGIAIFKIDGGEDQKLWTLLPTWAVGASETTFTASREVPSDSERTLLLPRFVMPTRNLQYGDRNENVRTLQQFLNSRGFIVATSGGGASGNETTFFGPATRSALVKFQQAHKIAPAIGFYGPITRGIIATL
jgi:spore germination protein YaaH